MNARHPGRSLYEKFQGPEPRYIHLAEELDRRIEGGEFGARGRLPSEAELTEQYGLSRVTVRQSMAILEKRGRVIRRRGVGTFVGAPKIHQDLSVLSGFYDALVAQGLTPDVTLLDYRQVVTDAKVAAKLQRQSATLIMRLYRVEGRPFAVTYTHALPEAARLTRDEVAANPTYRILESLLGYTIDRAELTIRAEAAGQGPGRLLDIGAAEPALVLERSSYEASGTPLEYTLCYLRADAYEFGLTLRGAFSIVNGFRAAPIIAPLAPE